MSTRCTRPPRSDVSHEARSARPRRRVRLGRPPWASGIWTMDGRGDGWAWGWAWAWGWMGVGMDGRGRGLGVRCHEGLASGGWRPAWAALCGRAALDRRDANLPSSVIVVVSRRNEHRAVCVVVCALCCCHLLSYFDSPAHLKTTAGPRALLQHRSKSQLLRPAPAPAPAPGNRDTATYGALKPVVCAGLSSGVGRVKMPTSPRTSRSTSVAERRRCVQRWRV